MTIRRYLRVSKYTVLETRIYLESPGLLTSWFLHPRDPILPKVIGAVKDLVLPKLHEDAERVKRGNVASKKRGFVKDTITGDGFEIVMFMTEGGTHHAVLSKSRHFRKPKSQLKSNSSKLVSAGDDEVYSEDTGIYLRTESEEPINLGDIPEAADVTPDSDVSEQVVIPSEGRHRGRRNMRNRGQYEPENSLMIDSGDEGDDTKEDKKPLARTKYDGFTIYSRALCLVVKRLDSTTTLVSKSASGTLRGSTQQANIYAPTASSLTITEMPLLETSARQQKSAGSASLMEEWITMTQMSRQDQTVD